MKTCTNCNETKELSEFYTNKRSSDGHQYACKVCRRKAQKEYHQKSPEVRKAWRERRLAADPQYNKYVSIKSHYNLTREQYDALLESQGGKCKTCDNTERLVVDHDHSCCSAKSRSCGKCVRGILCSNCNSVLGFVNDDSDVLKALIAYVSA